MGKLKDAIVALDNTVEDLTSLHVQTFTGELKGELNGAQTFGNLRKTVDAANAAGTIHLVAETLAQFDGDSYNFVKQDLNDVPPLALEVHKNAVKAGIETRVSLLNLFKGIL